MKSIFALTATILLVTFSSLAAVTANLGAIPNRALFGIDFGNGLEYYGRVGAINSISMQHYLVPGFRVYEMNIDMREGNTLLRIYATYTMDPVEESRLVTDGVTSQIPFGSIIADTMQEGYKLATGDIKSTVDTAATALPVLKDYPMTTHAKTIEYKVKSLDALKELFETLRDGWLRQPEAEDATTRTTTTTQSTNGTETATQVEEVEIVPLNGTLFRIE